MLNQIRSLLAAYHPIVHSLLIGTVLARAAASMSMPFLAIYLASHTGMNEVMIGLTVGASWLAGAFGGFFGGALSDLFGRRRVMLAALYVWALVFYGFAIGEHPLFFLLLSIMGGVCRAIYEPVSQALMADLTEPEKRLRVFSLRYLCINLGVAVGPLLGAYLALRGDALPFYVTAVVYLAYAVSIQAMLRYLGIQELEEQSKEDVTFGQIWHAVWRDVALCLFLLGGTLISIGYSQMTVTLSQYLAAEMVDGVRLFAVLMSTSAITVIVLQYPLTRWVEKRSPLFNVVVGVCFYALGLVGFAVSFNWTLFILSMVVFTLGEILSFPASNLLIDRLAPAGMRGAYFGAQSLTNLGHFFGPALGGLFLASYGGPIMFMIMAGISLFSIVFYWGGQRQYNRRFAKAQQQNDRLRA